MSAPAPPVERDPALPPTPAMYRYDEYDRRLVAQRVEQFRDQVRRRLAGELTEEEFRPLRLMNGLYLQLHAYMLRVAVPYGTLSAAQLRRLAHIARRYDKGFAHVTTRQNFQYNWPRLEDVPDILAELAEVEMHAIQTSGNCIRNVTADPFAGVAAGEVADPRPYAEIIRQWSTLHPEFSFLPRKFKIAVSGMDEDRSALATHDIALRLRRDGEGALGFEVLVGGGQGRTPMLAKSIRAFLPEAHLLSYLEAILRVYNRLGRRDNLFKARIKILVHTLGAARFAALVEEEWAHIRETAVDLPAAEVERIRAFFRPPPYDSRAAGPEEAPPDPAYVRWRAANVADHKVPGHAIVILSLKPVGGVPGDITADQMDAVADLAERYSFAEIRATQDQNLILPHVRRADLPALWRALVALDLASPNAGLAGDIVACPGLDYCNLANARSIPVARRIGERFRDLDRLHGIGEIKIKISGCINACGHHHVGHIGILGVDKKGEEYYQITLGGDPGPEAAIGTILGPALPADRIVDAVETIVDTYLALRREGERFIDTYRRTGAAPFKEKLYGTDQGQ